MSRHVAVFTLLNPGHLYPTLGLCAELVSRGFRVTYPTTERFAEQIRQTGAEPVVMTFPEAKNPEKKLWYPPPDHPKLWELLTSLFWPNFLTTAEITLAEIERFYSDNVPDLVIYDLFSFAGRIQARRAGCPAIQHWAHFAHHDALIRQDGVCLNPEPALGFAQLVNSFMSAHGIDDNHGLWHREDLGIYFVPREFQFDADSFDDRFCFVGPCLNRPPRAAWNDRSGDKPMILISESAANKRPNFLQTCIDAFTNTDYHVVLSLGENSVLKDTHTLPANFELNKGAYNTAILPHADLMICQTGMGSALESLYHGVPVLGVPLSPYHAEVSYRIAELGLGLELLEPDMTVNSLREAAARILGDDMLQSRMKHMQESVRNSGGAKKAADRIEGFFSGTRIDMSRTRPPGSIRTGTA